jgi:hypothetical protein
MYSPIQKSPAKRLPFDKNVGILIATITLYGSYVSIIVLATG